ncbi:MAG TPA: hypothetical protein PLZ84_05830 [Clostridia bacterium]|nr:hypothetical protein [Clostridia bacterium]
MRVPVLIESRDKTLTGVLHIAKKQRKTPVCAIMCYGLNGNRAEQHRMSVKLARMCEDKGINFLRFDYADVGLSDGDFFCSTLCERIQNALDAESFLAGCFNSDIRLYPIGFSDGAKIALTSFAHSEHIGGIILLNPIINIDSKPSKAREACKLALHPVYKKPYKALYGNCLNTQVLREMESDRSLYMINPQTAMLFIFGSKDAFTEDIRSFLEDHLQNHSNKAFKLIEGAGHLFGRSDYEAAANAQTISWILEKEIHNGYL